MPQLGTHYPSPKPLTRSRQLVLLSSHTIAVPTGLWPTTRIQHKEIMAMPASTTTWMEAAFSSAKKEFLQSLNKTTSTFDFSKLATVDDVYEAAGEIQRQQAKTKSFRGLKRIEPFVKVLQEYSGVADTFAQIQPEIASLIWVRLLKHVRAGSGETTNTF